MPITLNILSGEASTERTLSGRVAGIVRRVEQYTECAFCDMELDSDAFGIACCECANEVWQCCEQCEVPTYTRCAVPRSLQAFAELVAEFNPRYLPGESSIWESTYASRSFLPRAFGLPGIPNARIRPEDDRHIFVCSSCIVNCDSCGAPYRDPDSAYECCLSDCFSCPDCGELWDESYEAEGCCRSRLLRDYSYSPPLSFYRLDEGVPIGFCYAQPGTLFMGMELELERATSGLESFLSNAGEPSDNPTSILWK